MTSSAMIGPGGRVILVAKAVRVPREPRHYRARGIIILTISFYIFEWSMAIRLLKLSFIGLIYTITDGKYRVKGIGSVYQEII